MRSNNVEATIIVQCTLRRPHSYQQFHSWPSHGKCCCGWGPSCDVSVALHWQRRPPPFLVAWFPWDLILMFLMQHLSAESATLIWSEKPFWLALHLWKRSEKISRSRSCYFFNSIRLRVKTPFPPAIYRGAPFTYPVPSVALASLPGWHPSGSFLKRVSIFFQIWLREAARGLMPEIYHHTPRSVGALEGAGCNSSGP